MKSRICIAAINASGDVAAAVDASGGLHIFDICSGSSSLALREAPPAGALCFVRRSRDEVMYGVGHRVRVVDAQTKSVITSLLGHKGDVHFATAAESWALTHSHDAVILWSSTDWSRVRALVEPSAFVLAAELSPRGDRAAVLYSGSRVAVWSTSAGSPQVELKAAQFQEPFPEGLQRLAVGRSFIAAATVEEPGKDAIASSLVLWRFEDERMCASGCLTQPDGLVVQLKELVLQLHARNDSLYVTHSAGVRVMDTKSQKLALALEVSCILHSSVDAAGSSTVLVRTSGELEWHGLAGGQQGRRRSTPAAPHRRRASLRLAAGAGEGEPLAACSAAEALPPRRRLLALLKRHGAYPESCRLALWRLLLQLPRSERAHTAVCEAVGAGTKAHAESMASQVEIADSKECQRLARVISALTTWAPVLADVPYVSAAVSPFVKVFASDEVLAFEMCAAFLLNWVSRWLEVFPNPPLEDLSEARDLFKTVDPELLGHLEACVGADEAPETDVRAAVLWPMVRVALSNCLPRDVWLVLWDHLTAYWHDRRLLSVAAVAVLRCLRGVLLALPLRQPQRFYDTLKQKHVLPPAKVLEEFLTLRGALPKRREPLAQRLLPRGDAYPPLLTKPHFVLDYHVRDRARARARAEDARQAVEAAKEVHVGIQDLIAKENALRASQAELLRQEQARRVLAKEDDERLLAEQTRHLRAAAATRLQRIEHTSAAAEAWLVQQQELHDAELGRLADEEAQQRSRLSQETEELRLESTLGDLEAKASRQVVELCRQRQVEMASRQARQGVRAELLEREHENELTWRQQRLASERERLDLHADLSQQVQELQLTMLDAQQREVETELAVADNLHDAQLSQISQARFSRAVARKAQTQLDARLRCNREQLEADTEQFSRDAAEQVWQLRQQREQRLEQQQSTLLQERALLNESMDQQDRQRQETSLAEERVRFRGLINRRILADQAQAQREEEGLQQEISSLEHARMESEQEQARLERRRKLAEQRDVELSRVLEQGTAERLPKEERRHLRRRLTRHLTARPHARSSTVLLGPRRPVTPLTPYVDSSLGSATPTSGNASPPEFMSRTPTVLSSDSEGSLLLPWSMGSGATPSDRGGPRIPAALVRSASSSAASSAGAVRRRWRR